MKLCYDCMKEIPEDASKCPYCGYSNSKDEGEVYYIKPGNVLGNRYVIGRVIGFGGFGIVYKAWDNNLSQMVAVKEYFTTVYVNRIAETNEVTVFDKKNTELFDKGKEDFLLEARTVAKYNKHPNIVHIYDFFEENGTSYFVMEYVDGYTLKDYINEAKRQGMVFAVDSAVDITLGVLNALEQTHADGIIHRDIKPSNIFVTEDGNVKLFDFGAARLSDSVERTRTVIITPGYAPPEQYQINSVQGAYTDIYAIGAMLYEMLTGIKPQESINRKIIDDVAPPSAYNSKIPRYLDSIIMRAMAVRPEVRFKNIEVFKTALISKKNIRNDKEEIRRRRVLKNIKIAAAILLILALGGYCADKYYRSYKTATLSDTSINIWICDKSNDIEATQAMYYSMLEEFTDTYPQVDINIDVISMDEYAERLSESFATGTEPELFMSTDIDADICDYFADIDSLYDDVDVNSYFLLDKYKNEIIATDKVPIAFDVPVRYTNIMSDNLSDSDVYESFT